MKTRFFLLAGLMTIVITGFAGAALAMPGMTTDYVKLRAGPSSDYAVIARIAPRSGIEIEGCIRDWTWCDVVVGNMRGWASYKHLRVLYHHHPERIGEVGVSFGLPVVVFDLEDYWDRHYQGQSFYVEYFRHHPHHHHYDHDHDWHHNHDHDGHDNDRNHDHDWHHDDNDSHWHHHD
ncbi:MAG TPA: hypothetical protein VL625_11815 [Patescibacteria group bacterium]|nr:hypothetical protein [Patescibacteria group bacterium]